MAHPVPPTTEHLLEKPKINKQRTKIALMCHSDIPFRTLPNYILDEIWQTKTSLIVSIINSLSSLSSSIMEARLMHYYQFHCSQCCFYVVSRTFRMHLTWPSETQIKNGKVHLLATISSNNNHVLDAELA